VKGRRKNVLSLAECIRDSHYTECQDKQKEKCGYNIRIFVM